MKKKKIYLIISALIITLIVGCVSGYVIYNINTNENRLKRNINALEDKQSVKLNEITPFEWDYLYSFYPYTSQESIEKIIGFKTQSNLENMVNEGMVYLIFVKDKKVICKILGYSERLGYTIECLFEKEKYFSIIKYEDNIQYICQKENGINELKLKN